MMHVVPMKTVIYKLAMTKLIHVVYKLSLFIVTENNNFIYIAILNNEYLV